MQANGIDKRLRALDRLEADGRPRSALELAAIRRQSRDLESGHERGLCWDEFEATRAIEFCGLLRHWKGKWAGKPFILEPWQEHLIIAPLFGWYREKPRSAGGKRRFRTGYCEVPRKNGKTSLAAPIALQGLIADFEQGAEVYAAATKREQADILFVDAKNMARGSVHLMKAIKQWRHSITCAALNSSFKPLSADYNSMHGLNVSRAIIDEIHSHKTRNVWDIISTSTGSRAMPLVFGITTAGYDRSTICWDLHEISRKVLQELESDDSFFCFIACADEKDDPFDPETHRKANPNYDVSISGEYLAQEAKKAKASPAYENTFKRLHLNLWTEQAVRVIPMDSWRACADPTLTEESMLGRYCYCGLDLSSTQDVTAFVKIFPLGDGKYAALEKFWIPSEHNSARSEQDQRTAINFANQGHIIKTSGNEVDYTEIVDFIMADALKFDLRGIGFDPWNARMLMQTLVNNGFWEDKRHAMTQNFTTYNEPLKKLLAMLATGRFAHTGNPAFDWMASNTAAKTDPSGNMRPDKGKSADKIDGICALLMGLALAFGEEVDSIYSQPGNLVL